MLKFRDLAFATILVLAWPSVSYSAALLDEIETYSRSEHNRDLTECDVLAGHASDPENIGPGVTPEGMDKPAAIKACLKAVKADPTNPRLNYQLARAYGYSGLHEEGDPYRMAALKAGYPQSLFVFGYIRISGWDDRPADPCLGGELIRRSAIAGRLAGQLGFPYYVAAGTFDGCKDYPKVDRAEIREFLNAAKPESGQYYQGLLKQTLLLYFKED